MTLTPQWFEDLTADEKKEVLARYDERERARVYAEWCTDGREPHECDPLDTYCGGCAVCGLPLAEKVR